MSSVANSGEVGRNERGPADEAAIDVGHGKELGSVSRLHAAPVDDARRRRVGTVAKQLATDGRMHGIGLHRARGPSRADRPYRLIGQDDAQPVGCRNPRGNGCHLAQHDSLGLTGVTFRKRLADADDRDQLVGDRRLDLPVHVLVGLAEQLAPLVPKDRVLVAESGLGSPADLARMAKVGAQAFLIGESFMRQPDVETAVRHMLVREAA